MTTIRIGGPTTANVKASPQSIPGTIQCTMGGPPPIHKTKAKIQPPFPSLSPCFVATVISCFRCDKLCVLRPCERASNHAKKSFTAVPIHVGQSLLGHGRSPGTTPVSPPQPRRSTQGRCGQNPNRPPHPVGEGLPDLSSVYRLGGPSVTRLGSSGADGGSRRRRWESKPNILVLAEALGGRVGQARQAADFQLALMLTQALCCCV